MINTTPTASRTKLRGGWKALGTTAVIATVGFGVAACGGGSKSPAAASDTSTQSSTTNTPRTLPGAFGTIASLASDSMQIQNAQSGQTEVDYSSSTTITKEESGSLSSVKVGDCVVAQGTASTTDPTSAITVTRVTISSPVDGACASGFGPGAGGGGFGGGGFGGGGFGGRTRPSGAPTFTPRSPGAGGRTGGGFADISVATGKVTAVSSTGFTVSGRLTTGGFRRGASASPSPAATPATTTIAVTPGSKTTYTEDAASTSSALAVGQCVSAVGSSSDTGAVTAKSITIFSSTATCTAVSRFSGGGSGGGFGGAGAPGSGTNG